MAKIKVFTGHFSKNKEGANEFTVDEKYHNLMRWLFYCFSFLLQIEKVYHHIVYLPMERLTLLIKKYSEGRDSLLLN